MNLSLLFLPRPLLTHGVFWMAYRNKRRRTSFRLLVQGGVGVDAELEEAGGVEEVVEVVRGHGGEARVNVAKDEGHGVGGYVGEDQGAEVVDVVEKQ